MHFFLLTSSFVLIAQHTKSEVHLKRDGSTTLCMYDLFKENCSTGSQLFYDFKTSDPEEYWGHAP